MRFYENWLPRGKELIREYNETYSQRIQLRDKLFELEYIKGKTWYVSRLLNTKNLKTNTDLLKLLDLEGDIYRNNFRVLVPIIKEAEDIILTIDKTLKEIE